MILKGIDDQSVELKITNYQFPQINDGDWDSNWLLVYLNVNSKFGNWQTIDASLTTWEVKRLINWLDLISNNKIQELEVIEFTEPNLSFAFLRTINSQKIIKIIFELESRPISHLDDIEYHVEFHWTNSDLKNYIKLFEEELEKFPERYPKE
jgi:hypothetical protein